MIRYQNIRNGDMSTVVKGERSLEKALESMVKYEIGYGGQITKLEKNCIVVHTNVLGARDEVTFSGESADFGVMVHAAAVTLQLEQEIRKNNDGNPFTKGDLDNIMEVTKGNPLMIKMASGILIGTNRIRKIYLGMINPYTKEKLEKLLEKSEADLLSLIVIRHEDGEEAFDLLAYGD